MFACVLSCCCHRSERPRVWHYFNKKPWDLKRCAAGHQLRLPAAALRLPIRLPACHCCSVQCSDLRPPSITPASTTSVRNVDATLFSLLLVLPSAGRRSLWFDTEAWWDLVALMLKVTRNNSGLGLLFLCLQPVWLIVRNLQRWVWQLFLGFYLLTLHCREPCRTRGTNPKSAISFGTIACPVLSPLIANFGFAFVACASTRRS
jgi:hypothetical protein